MLILISPSKNLDFKPQETLKAFTMPGFPDESIQLMQELKKMGYAELRQLLGISPQLARLTHERIQAWHYPFSPAEAKQAILAYSGDVYAGLDALSFSRDDFTYAQSNLRILSALYGILRPLDLMQPHRLDMKTPLKTDNCRNLYEFWSEKITRKILELLNRSEYEVLINLASEEYFRAVDTSLLSHEVITPVFKDYHDGKYVTLGTLAKKARGLMSRFIIRNRLTDPERIKLFAEDGYFYNDPLSQGNTWVFTRG
jgi:cytoplasmic iron level regulating protein YaaA (DUF328/UPF0246 family)